MSDLSCKECGAPVEQLPGGTLVRSCEHTGTVVYHMRAQLVGKGGMRHDSDKLRRFMVNLINLLRARKA